MKIYFTAALFLLSVFCTNAQVDYLIDSVNPSLFGRQDRIIIEKYLDASHSSKTDTAKFGRISEMIEKLADNVLVSKYNEYLITEIEKKLKEPGQTAGEVKKLRSIYGNCCVTRGYYLETASKDEEAMKSDEEALKILTPLGDKKGIANAIINIGYLYEKQNKFRLTLDYYRKALKLREEIKDYNGIVLSLSDIGYICQELGEEDTAYAYYKKAIDIGEKHEGTDNIAFAYNNIAGFYLDRGDLKNGMGFYEKCAAIQLKKGDSTSYATTLSNMAILYKDQGNIPLSLEMQNRSLKIREKTGNKPGQAASLNNLSALYIQQGNYDEALQTCRKGLEIAEQIKSYKLLASFHTNIGKILSIKGNKEAAKKEYFMALHYAELRGDIGFTILMHRNIGGIYSTMDNPDSAIYHMNICIAYFEKNQSMEKLAEMYGMMSGIWYQKKDLTKSKVYAEKSYALSKKLGYPELIYQAAEKLQELYYRDKEYKKAYDFYHIYVTMYDSIKKESNKKSATKQLLQYEYDKKTSLLKADQDKKDAIAQAENRKQRIILISVSLGLLLMVVLAVVILKSLRTNRKKNQIISLQKAEVERQKEMVEHQKEMVEEKQKEMVDSIHYAKRIQQATLASETLLKKNLDKYFLFFKPKDIVSGDFYWAAGGNSETGAGSSEKENSGLSFSQPPTFTLSGAEGPNSQLFYLAVCDSTGHGVPGAFMSLLNISYLNEAITERGISMPDEILGHVRKRLIQSLKDDGSEEGGKDGMDGTLMVFDKENSMLHFACANNPLILVRNGEIREFAADKMPVGRSPKENAPFTLQSIQLQKGDVIYSFTDGFEDQFGGPKGKKFKYRQLLELLLSLHELDPQEQKAKLEEVLTGWMSKLEQVDDISLIGIKI